MTADDRTEDMALLPAEREMSAEAWAQYGGLPPGLRSYCWRLMRQEGDARAHLREAELEVAEWRDRAARLLARVEAAEAALAQARAEGEAAGLARALAVVEARAAAREEQVDVAAEAGGAVDAVRLKAGELRAVAEEIRRAAADPAVTR